MERIFLLDSDKPITVKQVGGKGVGLSQLSAAGCRIPRTVCITSRVYDDFLDHHGLREKIALILNRKPQEEMRWEEIWDTALRIKALFLSAPIPQEIHQELSCFLKSVFHNAPVAVRSSATDEDQTTGSFAGLHESYLDISFDQILVHVKKVWASLWSDRALLYRRELDLSVEKSRMAVVVQEMLQSQVSGVCFTRDPMGSDDMVVEAVYGLNQGLVDGQIEPDRWFLDQAEGSIRRWIQPQQRKKKSAAREGVMVLEDVADAQQDTAPLTTEGLVQLKTVCLGLAQRFNQPLDIEWTISNGHLYLLQARPISTLGPEDQGDKRVWYLSLHRSYDNLLQLLKNIENDVLPAMESEAAEFARVDPEQLDDDALAEAITYRMDRSGYWTDVYWKKCIPFAHGVRLFGEIYNELLTPADPYEFVQLLSNQKMLSTHRNKQLLELASLVNRNQALKKELEGYDGTSLSDPEFNQAFEELFSRFGFFFPGVEENAEYRRRFAVKVILEYTQIHPAQKKTESWRRDTMEQQFLSRMDTAPYPFTGRELLELARSSYRIRDDDNIYLGKIDLQANAAVNAGRRRLAKRSVPGIEQASPDELTAMLKGRHQSLESGPLRSSISPDEKQSRVVARQVLGQPAAKGIAHGIARVVLKPEDLMNFQAGEVLVVDSIDPNMTFIVPLAAAIVEKRGGMLIHGAIIAREYGIPCITGISDATMLIATGDRIIVDGYLGIVTIDKKGKL